MENRFQKIRELGSKGKRSNPLLLEEFQWENEWVTENDLVHEGDDLTWNNVDEVIGATEGLQGRHFPRAAAARASASATDASARLTYTRTKKRPRRTAAPDIAEDVYDSDEQNQEIQTESARAMEEDEDSGSDHEAAAHEDFHLDDDLLN